MSSVGLGREGRRKARLGVGCGGRGWWGDWVKGVEVVVG